MRVSFSFGGGGPHRNRGPRRYRRSGVSVSVPLGPIGSIIVSIIFILVGLFNVFIGVLGSVISLLIGGIFIAVGIFTIVNSVKKINGKHYEDSSLDE